MDFLFSILVNVLSIILQTGLPPTGNGPVDPGPGGDQAPITGGILYLLLAAIGLGVKKYSDRNKKNNLHE